MNFILYGEQYPMIKKRLGKILEERLGEPDSFNVVKFDLDDVEPEEIFAEAELLPLGYDRKCIVVDHATFLGNGAKKEIRDAFTNLIKNSSDEIDIILIHRNGTIDDKCELVKHVEEHGRIFNFKNLTKDDWPIYVRKFFADREIQIDNAAVDELIQRVDGDLYRFMNEAQKLALYKKKITVSDVALMVAKPLEDNVFQLSNALLRGDNESAVAIFRDLQKLDSRTIEALIPMLGTQFRFMSQVLFLKEKGLSEGLIAQQLGASIGRFKASMYNCKHFSRAKIAIVLDNLYQLDSQIKSGQIDRSYGFELFLINFPN